MLNSLLDFLLVYENLLQELSKLQEAAKRLPNFSWSMMSYSFSCIDAPPPPTCSSDDAARRAVHYATWRNLQLTGTRVHVLPSFTLRCILDNQTVKTFFTLHARGSHSPHHRAAIAHITLSCLYSIFLTSSSYRLAAFEELEQVFLS
jgi:hypothetical protein